MAQPYKKCPRCDTPAELQTISCNQCGHVYRQIFTPPSLNQTQVVGIASPAAPMTPYPVPVRRQRQMHGCLVGLIAMLCTVGAGVVLTSILIVYTSTRTARSPSKAAERFSPVAGEAQDQTVRSRTLDRVSPPQAYGSDGRLNAGFTTPVLMGNIRIGMSRDMVKQCLGEPAFESSDFVGNIGKRGMSGAQIGYFYYTPEGGSCVVGFRSIRVCYAEVFDKAGTNQGGIFEPTEYVPPPIFPRQAPIDTSKFR